MRGQSRVSHSSCDCFDIENDGCPLQYFLKYIDRVTPEPKFIDWAFAGSYTHNTIEETLNYFVNIGIDELIKLPDIQEAIVNKVQEIYDKSAHTIPEASDKKDDDDTILNCLGNWSDFMVSRYDYLESQDMIEKYLPVLVEKGFEKNINGAPFYGLLDAAFIDTQIWPFDWKTNKDPKIKASQVRQGVRYALLTDGFFPEPIDSFYVINLRKKINLAKSKISITPEMRQQEYDRIGKLWQGMNKGPYPKNKKACFFCEYKKTCMLYDEAGCLLGNTNIAEGQGTIEEWI